MNGVEAERAAGVRALSTVAKHLARSVVPPRDIDPAWAVNTRVWGALAASDRRDLETALAGSGFGQRVRTRKSAGDRYGDQLIGRVERAVEVDLGEGVRLVIGLDREGQIEGYAYHCPEEVFAVIYPREAQYKLSGFLRSAYAGNKPAPIGTDAVYRAHVVACAVLNLPFLTAAPSAGARWAQRLADSLLIDAALDQLLRPDFTGVEVSRFYAGFRSIRAYIPGQPQPSAAILEHVSSPEVSDIAPPSVVGQSSPFPWPVIPEQPTSGPDRTGG